MPKERNFNPVQAQRKAEKAKQIKKGKADLASKRNERLANRNPERIQKQIDDLKAITTGGGKLSRHEEQVLEGLEKELKAVNKAREALGDKAPTFERGGPREGGRVLGKRRRDANDASSSDSDVPDDVKSIPMPRDTPPPIPKEILDKWYAKRRAARQNPNMVPLGSERIKPVVEPQPVVEAKTVYEAKPIVRDLRKEAVSAFVPAAVRAKIEKGKGNSGLLEPEEADELEREGYLKNPGMVDRASPRELSPEAGAVPRNVTMEDAEDEEG